MKVRILNNKYNNQEVEVCPVGYYSKRWINRGNYRFLAKLNENETTSENFGEVIYSHLGKKLGLNCVESVLANIEVIDKKLLLKKERFVPTNNGVIIKDFLANGGCDISLEEMLSDYYKSQDFSMLINGKESPYFDLSVPDALSPFVSITNIDDYLRVVEAYARVHNAQIDMQKTRQEVYKYLILDWFLMQEDRSKANIAFILKDDKLTLAPCFDNGRCLVFYENPNALCINFDHLEYYRKRMPLDVDFSKPNKTQLLPENMDYYNYDIAKDTQSLKKIYEIAKNDAEIEDFINKLSAIDLGKELDTLNTLAEWEGCAQLTPQATNISKYYFDYKVRNYRNYVNIQDKQAQQGLEL